MEQPIQQSLFGLHPFFRSSSELFIYGTPVVKHEGKKKRLKFLCIAKTQQPKSTPTLPSAAQSPQPPPPDTDESWTEETFVYVVKSADVKGSESKASFRKHIAWKLVDIIEVDGVAPSDNTSFTIVVRKKAHQPEHYRWDVPPTYREGKLLFLEFLFKEARRTYGGDAEKIPITFANMPQELTSRYGIAARRVGLDEGKTNALLLKTPSSLEYWPEDVTHQQKEALMAVKPDDEQYIEKLLMVFRSSKATSADFQHGLREEINKLEEANVNDLVMAHELVSKMFTRADEALDRLKTLDKTLNRYTDMMNAVSETVSIMEEQSYQMKVRRRNLDHLEADICAAVDKLSFSIDDSNALLNDSLSDESLSKRIEDAAFRLLSAIDAPLPPGFQHLPAVKTTRRDMEKLRRKFSARLTDHLNNCFISVSNAGVPAGVAVADGTSTAVDAKTAATYESFSDHKLAIRVHNADAIHCDLERYSGFLEWLKAADRDSYDQLMVTYSQSMTARTAEKSSVKLRE